MRIENGMDRPGFSHYRTENEPLFRRSDENIVTSISAPWFWRLGHALRGAHPPALFQIS